MRLRAARATHLLLRLMYKVWKSFDMYWKALHTHLSMLWTHQKPKKRKRKYLRVDEWNGREHTNWRREEKKSLIFYAHLLSLALQGAWTMSADGRVKEAECERASKRWNECLESMWYMNTNLSIVFHSMWHIINWKLWWYVFDELTKPSNHQIRRQNKNHNIVP